MIKRGQIKFTKKAAEKAKVIFQRKKIDEFLFVIESGAQKPPNSKALYKKLLGVKQDPTSLKKVYTTNLIKAEKLFNTSLLKDGRLSLIFSPTYGCALYITKEQQVKYNAIKLKSLEWPAVYLDESNKEGVAKFEVKIKNKSVDLADIILDLKEVQ